MSDSSRDARTERVVSSFLEMVQIDSPSHHEAAMADYCAGELERMGFSVTFDASAKHTGSDTNQIIAHRAGDVPAHIALSSHMDCVVPCTGVVPVIRDGVIYSDGTTVLGSDDKSGIAEIFEGIRRLDESGAARPEITVLLSVCEEQSVAGAPAFPEVLFDEPTLTLVLDADGSAGSIIKGAPYHWVFDAKVTGRAAHAGVNPEEGKNAIVAAAQMVCAFPQGRHDEYTTANVGLIDGGAAKNIVAEHAHIVGECRSLIEARALEVKTTITEAFERVACECGVTLDLEWELSYPGFLYEEDDEDIVLLSEVAREMGLSPRITTSGGGSDANVLGPKGAKALALGTGMTDFHSTSEHVTIKDLDECSEYVYRILAQYAKRAE